MTNLERLEMETKNISLTEPEKTVYLMENNLTSTADYDPTSNTNKKNILKTALSILNAIANDLQLMKNYKSDDITVSGFSDALEARINSLERQIRQLPDDNDTYNDGASFVYLFNN